MKSFNSGRKLWVSFILIIAILFVSIQDFALGNDDLDEFEVINYSINPPPQRTGAPGENDCTQCHSGSIYSAAGSIDYSFSGNMNQYYPDSTYTISLGTTTNAINGFEMTILDNNALMAGTFSADPSSSVVSSGLREYVRQSNPNNSSWSFQWTAPSTDVGNLTVYYAFNKANNSGTTLGDSIFLGQETIFISPSASLDQSATFESTFQLHYNHLSNTLNISFSLAEQSAVALSIFDLSGRQIYFSDLGEMSADSHQIHIQMDESIFSGLAIVHLNIDANDYAQKVLIK